MTEIILVTRKFRKRPTPSRQFLLILSMRDQKESKSVVREGVVDSDPEAISVYVRSKAPVRYVSALRPDRRLLGYGLSLSGLAYR
jgi:hypothetical protein